MNDESELVHNNPDSAPTVMDQLIIAMSARLPLRIDAVDYNDPMVVLRGVDWSLSVACPWRLTRAGHLVCSYGDDTAEEELRRLLGESIVRTDPPRSHQCDPAFKIGDELLLEVFSDTDLDPWVVRLPGHTFVGAASTRP